MRLCRIMSVTFKLPEGKVLFWRFLFGLGEHEHLQHMDCLPPSNQNSQSCERRNHKEPISQLNIATCRDCPARKRLPIATSKVCKVHAAYWQMLESRIIKSEE